MIKVLHIAKPLSGVGTYIKLLSKYSNKEKIKNEIILNRNDNNIQILDSTNTEIKSYHADIEREINFVKDLKVLFQVFNVVKISKPDVIHCHSAKAGILGRIVGTILGIRTFYTPHAYSYLSIEQTNKRRILKFIEKFFSYSPALTLTCSLSEYKKAIHDLKINKSKVYLWNNSIEKNIKIKKLHTSHKIPNRYICTIGRPSYQKNTELLIHAVREIKCEYNDIHLVILGCGFHSPDLEFIKLLIKKFDLSKNITLINWMDREETLSILKNSLFYISSSRYEGLPYSVIEALSLGKPCVLSNVDGHKDLIIDNFNGFLVDQKPSDFKHKSLELLNDDFLRNKMSNNSKIDFMLKYDIEKNINSLEKLYLSS